jgi:hypothetical protein
MIKLKITFYRLSKCGYYRGGQQPPVIGDLALIMDELNTFSTGSDGLVNTCTYGVGEEGNALRTFCFNFNKSDTHGDYLLTTWNEVPTVEGKIPSVDENQQVGDEDVKLTEVGEHQIPGHPAYFWIIPERNVYATIVPEGKMVNGNQNFVKYMNGFMANFVSFILPGEATGHSRTTVGYQLDEDTEIALFPAFRSGLWKNPAIIDKIVRSCSSIRKIIRKTTLDAAEAAEESTLKALAKTISLESYEPVKNLGYHVKYEIDLTPTGEELEAIINGWNRNHDSKTQWDNVGFELQGESGKVYWLDSSLARDDIEIPVEEFKPGFLSGASLLEKLTEDRDYLFGLMK